MIAFQSIPPIITIAIMESKRQRDCGHYHNRDMSTYAERLAEARKASGITTCSASLAGTGRAGCLSSSAGRSVGRGGGAQPIKQQMEVQHDRI